MPVDKYICTGIHDDVRSVTMDPTLKVQTGNHHQV